MAVDGAARRRRERLGHWKHECLSVRMAVAVAMHHGSGKRVVATAEVAVQTAVTEHVAPAPDVIVSPPSSAIEYVAPAHGRARKKRHFENVTSEQTVTCSATSPVSGYVDPASDHTCAALAPVVGFVDPAPTDAHLAPAPVIDHVAAPAGTFSAPVSEYVHPAPAVTYVAPAPVIESVGKPAVLYAAPAQVTEFAAPAPAATNAALAPVIEYVTCVPAVTYATPAPEHTASARDVTYTAPVPVTEYVDPAAAAAIEAALQ